MPVRERVRQRRFPSLAAEALVSLVVAADHFTQQADALCARHGITGDQMNVLRILRGAHPQGHPRFEVGLRLMRRSPDVTRLLDRLERQGLVERARSGDDARLSVARITKPGLKLLATIDPELDELMQSVTRPVSQAQLRQLARLCDALVP
ncbi:MAG: MarR family transcriptional regulator [Acidobacteria bacterium]|nr:MAG: MarR family transcriptional regulator [Acidobacteriota bacterium]PYR54232.1 MAG: MarR family transcriptional regulator [Acidobacteriota bacterium]